MTRPLPRRVEVDPATIDDSLLAAARGEATVLQSGELKVLIAPATQQVFQRTALDDKQLAAVQRFLLKVLDSAASVTRLPPWKERPDCRLHNVAVAFGERAHSFNFVIVPRLEQGEVVVAACDHHSVPKR